MSNDRSTTRRYYCAVDRDDVLRVSSGEGPSGGTGRTMVFKTDSVEEPRGGSFVFLEEAQLRDLRDRITRWLAAGSPLPEPDPLWEDEE